MSLLTSRQADELHKSIIAYLTANRLTAAVAALRTELNLNENEFDPATTDKYKGLLEKKMDECPVSLQIMDLESRNAALQSELDNATPVSLSMRNKDPSSWLPNSLPRSDLTIKLWDPANDYKNIRTLPGHDHSVSALRFIPGSANLLVSASRDQTLKIWDVITGFCLKTLRGHTGWVRDVFPSFDGRYLLSSGDDMTARLWDISSTTQAESKVTMFGHEHHIECCAIAPPAAYKYIALAAGLKKPPPTSSSAEYMATGSRDKTIRLWDARGTCILSLVGHDNWVRALVFHPGGKYLLSVSDDKTLRCWDLNQDGRCVKVIGEPYERFITSLQWAPSVLFGAFQPPSRFFPLRGPIPMAGTIIITGANGSVAVHAVQHLLSNAPENTLVLTVRNTSDSDLNTKRLRETADRFPNARISIRKLDLATLQAVNEFADTIAAEVVKGKLPPLAGIVCNAFHWNMIADPELTDDALEKTMQVNHISHSALVLRLLGRNSLERYPPSIPDDVDELVKAHPEADRQGRGFQNYANSKLAILMWTYALNRYLEKAVIDPGSIADSRALRTNTPAMLSCMQRFLLQPLRPVLRLVIPDVRSSADAGIDVAGIVLNRKHTGERGYLRLMIPGPSSAESLDQAKQQKLWVKTAEWAKITNKNTALEGGFCTY
ncbi:hypothetical protein GQX73_g274 [Xylaria multiplex]|uniref:Uncharacterized protein n=1 Tax=Xylaria multiplex TaxID=323545 RepID=A0A7C8IZN8_9PEZI|nr:hypothetical protein GQX73_g274 [Xylaria multiplex]